ncbi:MAG: adenosylcobalamin-dependent ribonucleoside-diphosphate reductase [Synergistaceae bacterium]|nr:adenosylcobalamin-dependent ribonucleoside-diphosphate reductase [Synergistaceae bacterium]MBR0080171.1 adenosylcobalamin-dependent ribonucleoside-diphosphate reductase [Synergistaceae bacterium]
MNITEINIKNFFDLTADAHNINSSNLSENALWLLDQRYFVQRYDGEIKTTRKENNFEEFTQRVARTIASFETLYSDSLEWIKTLELNIRNDILGRRFLFNSPCLFSAAAGLTIIPELAEIIYKDISLMTLEDYKKLRDSKTKNQQLFACFVITVPDSIEGIFDSVKNASIISKFGGGVGGNFGHLREQSSEIAGGTGGKASGPVSFMETWNTMGAVVVQGGKRRAALMGMLFDDHPDIYEFIDSKTEDGKLSYFNISVAISDKLMRASEHDEDFDLHSRVDNSVVKTIKAKDLMNHICESAWKRGDPGVFFIDRARQDNILKLGGAEWDIESTNPCGEQPLPNFTSCNLGSVNIESFVDDGKFDWNKFQSQVFRSIYYLDLVIDACSYPLEKIGERTKAIRPVGLGIMGLADASIKQNIIYGSDEFNAFCEKLGGILATSALTATIKIVDDAKKSPFKEHNLVRELFVDERIPESNEEFMSMLGRMRNEGNIPVTLINTLAKFEFDDAKYILENLFKGNMRNSRRLSIAPTGSISMLMDTSSGIEPNFAWSWNRRIMKTDGSGFENREYWHRLLTPEQKSEYRASGGNLSNPAYVTAYDISTQQHVKVTGIFAQIVDSGISKTVNLPNSATIEDVRQVYQDCYNIGCKGITIYRDGSRSFQPIEVKKEEKKPETENKSPRVKARPGLVVFGKTIKDTTPWGSIYVTLNLDGKEPFEIFINVGKSGSELKAMTEALSRVISIGLRSGCSLEDFIDTLRGLSGKEYWMLNSDDDHVARSIPDAIALLLDKLIDRQVMTARRNDKNLICPECGAPLEMISGCEYCFSCGYSPCK